MLKYEYKNATVYITEPNEKHISRIREATTEFMKRVMKEKAQHATGKHNRRACSTRPGTRTGD